MTKEKFLDREQASLPRYRSLFCGQARSLLFTDILISRNFGKFNFRPAMDVEKYTPIVPDFIITNKHRRYFRSPVSKYKTEIVPGSIFNSVSVQFAKSQKYPVILYWTTKHVYSMILFIKNPFFCASIIIYINYND